MQFTYPAFLWALSAAIIPILIHLFNFRRYKTVLFSNVVFLKNIQKESKSKSKLKNLLLLLIRVLAIVFLVLAFAKPVIRDNESLSQAKQHIVGIYVDNSFSMDNTGKYGSLIEYAKLKAFEISDSYDLNTLFLLTTNDFEPKHHRLVNKDQFIDWLSQVKSSHISRPVNQVMAYQNQIFKSIDTTANVTQYIISDFQKSGFDISQYPDTSSVKCLFLPLKHQKMQNIYVDSVWFESPGHFVGKQEALNVKLVNYSENEVFDFQVNLTINDSLKGIATESFLPKEHKVISMPFVQSKHGWNTAKVEIVDYPIIFDNSIYFSFYIDRKIPVFEIKPNNGKSYFEALFSDDDNFSFESSMADGSFYGELHKYKVVIVNELLEFSTGLISALERYVNEGGRLVLIPSQSVNIQQYQLLLNEINGPTLGSWRNEQGVFQEIDLKHIFFKDAIKESDGELELPTYNGFFNTSISSRMPFETILSSESGAVVLGQGSHNAGDYLFLSIPLSGDISNWATHPLFIPVFYNLALYSSKLNNVYYTLQPNLIVKHNTIPKNILQLKHVNSDDVLIPRFVNTGGYIYLHPDETKLTAGHYQMLDDQAEVGHVSFNYSRKESVLDFYSVDELNNYAEQSLTMNIDVVEGEGSSMQKFISQQTKGRSLSSLFLLLVVGMLMTEVFLLRFLN